jgi:molybdopterin-guanine dinucleotide biosynthesis protein B
MDKHKRQLQHKKEKGKAPPIISIVGNSGSGKTTFLEKLIPEIVRRGLKVGTIKHHGHGFDMDKPGKDSWRHKQAGASTTMISSPSKIGLVMDVDVDHNPYDLIHFFKGMDIILAEGYKRGSTPKIEVFRPKIGTQPVCQDDERLLAVISESSVDIDVPRFSFHDIHQVVDFLIDHFNLIQTIE